MRAARHLRVAFATMAALGLVGTGTLGANASTESGPSGPDGRKEASRVIVGSDGSMTPAGDVGAQAKDCVGHYKAGNAPCSAGQLTVNTFATHKGCSNHGRHLMATVHKETADGRIGYYTYGCTEADGNYILAMAGFVKVTDTNATHDDYWG